MQSDFIGTDRCEPVRMDFGVQVVRLHWGQFLLLMLALLILICVGCQSDYQLSQGRSPAFVAGYQAAKRDAGKGGELYGVLLPKHTPEWDKGYMEFVAEHKLDVYGKPYNVEVPR